MCLLVVVVVVAVVIVFVVVVVEEVVVVVEVVLGGGWSEIASHAGVGQDALNGGLRLRRENAFVSLAKLTKGLTDSLSFQFDLVKPGGHINKVENVVATTDRDGGGSDEVVS